MGRGDRKSLFYPFVDNGKKYTVQVLFQREIKTDDGYNTGDDLIAWGEVTATAVGGSGEVLLKTPPAFSFEKNGNFTITSGPEFSGAGAQQFKDWEIKVECYAGTSWNHDDGKWKWIGDSEIKCDNISNSYNIFDLTKVDAEEIDFVNYFVAYQSDDYLRWSDEQIEMKLTKQVQEK